MSEYTILGFTEITVENIPDFVQEIKKRGSEEISQLRDRDLMQIINTFNVFASSYKDKELWTVLQDAVLMVSLSLFCLFWVIINLES